MVERNPILVMCASDGLCYYCLRREADVLAGYFTWYSYAKGLLVKEWVHGTVDS